MKLVRLVRNANPARLAVWLIALWKLFKHPQTPHAAKLVAICVLGYALSPIDLIPDSHPVIGILDDLILIPLGILAVRRVIPAQVMVECRQRAEAPRSRRSRLIAAAVIAVYCVAVAGFAIVGARGG